MTSSSLILLQLFLASCLAQDSGLYVNKIAINARFDDSNQFTYFVDDNYEAIQTSQFKNEAPSIGRLYEDDYAPDSTQCTTVECPKLRKLYAQVNQAGGKVTFTRIIDADIKKTVTGDVKSMGYLAPYPGYCSSDDSMPIVELYSDSLKTYAYWSPANPNQFYNMTTTKLDTSRYYAKRLLGYALTQSPARLVLENKTPDFVKTPSKGNYSQSVLPTIMFHEFTVDGRSMFVAKFINVDRYAAETGYTYKGPAFSMLMVPSGANGELIDLVCPERNRIYLFNRTVGANTYFSLITNKQNSVAVAAGWKMVGYQANTFSADSKLCGGVKGLAKFTELVYKTDANRFTYAADPAKITELVNTGMWTKTDRDLGWTPLDNTGILFFNREMNFNPVTIVN